MQSNNHPWFPITTYRRFLIGPLPMHYEFDPDIYDRVMVGPDRLMSLFNNSPLIDMARAHLCWGSIHICLFMYHARVFPTYDDIYILMAQLERFDPLINIELNQDHLLYLYHTVVGHFGYLNIDQTFYHIILAFYQRLMQDDLADDDTLILPVNFNHTELPHPFLQ